MRNHQAVLDTANGTIKFPHVELTLAMTDEMKNCNPKPLQTLAVGNQTLLLQQTTTVSAKVITTNTNEVTGAVQPLPQFDETAGDGTLQKTQHQNSQCDGFFPHDKESHKIGGTTNPET